MKCDRYTKVMLTIIAVFLGMIGLGRLELLPTVQAFPAANAFDKVEFSGVGNTFQLFDKTTGEVWAYSNINGRTEVKLLGQIDKPGGPLKVR